MKFHPPFVARSSLYKPVLGAIVGLTVFSAAGGGAAYADPAQDGVAKLKDLSRQAEQLIETVQAAQLDLDNKLQLQMVLITAYCGPWHASAAQVGI